MCFNLDCLFTPHMNCVLFKCDFWVSCLKGFMWGGWTLAAWPGGSSTASFGLLTGSMFLLEAPTWTGELLRRFTFNMCNTQVLLTHAGLFQETRLSFRWRSSGWWSTTVPAWQRTCTRSSSPTGWWDRPTARCHSAGPPSMTLPSTKTAPCWWKRGMSPVGFTLQWVSLVLLAIIFLLSLAWRMSSALWAI